MCVVTVVVGSQVTHFSLYELFDKFGFQGARRIFGALFTPEWAILPQGILAIVETIFIAFMATAFAIPVAFLLAFFAHLNEFNSIDRATYMGDHIFSLGGYWPLCRYASAFAAIDCFARKTVL